MMSRHYSPAFRNFNAALPMAFHRQTILAIAAAARQSSHRSTTGSEIHAV
jgi:hypothetical protein